MDKRIIQIADTYGYEKQSIMAIEEMSELTKAICKLKRIKDTPINAPINLEEYVSIHYNLEDEIADVQIMLLQLRHLLGMSKAELKELMDAKIERQLERIKQEKH